ncbi:MAG: TonB-dependent receptor, partial [Acidobacteria bacterium]|nr:TonB-dependent receptor [Acidobacteriota bacterium]
GIRRILTTNDSGVFTAPALVPAPGYQVSVKVVGFSAYEAKDLQLQVGQSMNLNVVLQVAQAATQVEVTGQAPLVEDTKTDVSQVVNQLQIQELPVNGRRVDSFVLLTPGVTTDGFYGQITFRGTNANNSFLTDGNDTTNSFFNENAGRTRITSQISQDAVQEFQVLSTSFTAEFGRASGGIVNTVTKSGSNGTHGTGYWFFRNQDFNARDRYATINPVESRHQAGGSIGGPIKTDKLFYFFNGEVTRRDFPGISTIVKPGVIDANTNWIGCGAPATPDQCTAANGILQRFAATIPRTVTQDLLFGKIDWRPNDRNSFSASLNYVRWVSPNGIQTGAAYNNGALLGSNGTTTVRDRYGRFSWTSVPSNSVVNEARFGWFKDRQADDLTQSSLPSFGAVTLTVAAVSNLGIANYLPRINPSENRFQYADTLAWTRGRHAMKFGIDVTNTEDYIYNISSQFGTYSYNTVTAFAQDLTGNSTGKKGYASFSQGLGTPSIDFTTRDWAFFAQDQFRATSKLTFNYGIRYEYSQLPKPTVSNPDYPQTARIPGRNNNFAPRFGVAYAVNDKTVLRGGYGMYYARYPGGILSTLLLTDLPQPAAGRL